MLTVQLNFICKGFFLAAKWGRGEEECLVTNYFFRFFATAITNNIW